MSARLTGVSPTVIARALIAACDHFQVDPTDCMGHGAAANARAAVGAALVAVMPRTGPKDGAVLAVGTLLEVNPTYMSPANLRMRGIGSELLLDLAEVMKAAGLNAAEIYVERCRANAAKPKAKASPPRAIAPATPVAAPSKSEPETVSRSRAPLGSGSPLRCARNDESKGAPAAPATPAGPFKRSMKANVRRWTRQFLNAGWTPREVARLFDRDVAQVKAAGNEAAHG